MYFGAAAAAATVPLIGGSVAAAQEAGADWLKEVKGTHRCLFDFPQFKNGMPLLHILNYLNTYREAYKSAPGTVGAVGTFYSIGPQASIPLAFNDAMWAKYELGDYAGLKDAVGQPYTRNVFYMPTKDELHAVDGGGAIADDSGVRGRDAGAQHQEPAEDGDQVPAVQQRVRRLVPRARSARQRQDGGHQQGYDGQPAAGRDVVPAMVIAIEQAQACRHPLQPAVDRCFAGADACPMGAVEFEESGMKNVIAAAVALLLAGSARRRSRAHRPTAQIAEAVQILPHDLRAGATVVTYDAATGARNVLRQGTNFIECQPRMADGFTRCYNKALGAAARSRGEAARARRNATRRSRRRSPRRSRPARCRRRPTGMMSYRGYDKRDRIQNLWVISLPNATPESVGVSTTSQRDAALEGKGLPWMMLPGTPGAHIMIPINPPAKTVDDHRPGDRRDRAGDAAAARGSARRRDRLQIRPEDRRAHGAARRARTTSSARRAAPTGSRGATTRSARPRRDFSAKLRAQGKSDKEIQEAVAAATKAGTLKPTPFGTMSYRLYGKKDRIQLLWVLSVPGATPETIGVSDGSQRDEAIATVTGGRG